MSDQYKVYIESKRLLDEKQSRINQELYQCEKELESLRASYSKTCDHPIRILQFPVCAICYRHVPIEK